MNLQIIFTILIPILFLVVVYKAVSFLKHFFESNEIQQELLVTENKGIEKNKLEIEELVFKTEVELKQYLATFIGKKITQVFYLSANYYKADFRVGKYDQIDLGIYLKFDDASYLNWVWYEDRMLYGYCLMKGDFIQFCKDNKKASEIADMSNDLKWKNIINKSIINIETETNLLTENLAVLSALKLQFENVNEVQFVLSCELSNEELLKEEVLFPLDFDYLFISFAAELLLR